MGLGRVLRNVKHGTHVVADSMLETRERAAAEAPERAALKSIAVPAGIAVDAETARCLDQYKVEEVTWPFDYLFTDLR